MSDISVAAPARSAHPRPATEKKTARTPGPVRAATLADVDLIYQRVCEVIDTSPYYSDLFKTFEKQRLNKRYLRSLIKADPWYVMVIVADDEPAGFMITSPQYGALWLHWSYIFPEKRRASLAMAGLKALIRHFDNGRFHKIATYTKPGNPAVALLHRFKFDHICTLENHIFGEDYMLFEKPLNKTEQGYDMGMGIGLMGRIKERILSLLHL
ncbi:MAG TPA: GNAT family N-acetyltransferase [Devosia sp.]|nr:GNAT family N-acetyltransferase [Devosia sp.]